MLILFFLAWIIFNGWITTEIIILGVLIAALVFAFMCKFTDYSPQKEKRFYRKMFSFCGYLFLLVKEIFKANLAVCRQIFAHNEIVEPIIVRFRAQLTSETARVMLANSITLTPGTITVSLQGDELVVHCLDKSLAEGLEASVFELQLLKMEAELSETETEAKAKTAAKTEVKATTAEAHKED